MKKNLPLVPLLGAVTFLSGCSAMQAARNAEMDDALVSGNYKSAAMLAEQRLGLSVGQDGALPDLSASSGSVLNHLEAGEAWRMAGETPRSLAHYDFAERVLQSVELQDIGTAGAKQIGAALVNDTLLDYKPSPAEAVLVNYYKAIAFWHEGDVDNVRVELNRAEDRIRRSVERYEKEIAAAQAENAGKPGGDDATMTKIEAQLGMNEWKPYEGFVMPQATYLHALFLATSGVPSDKDMARTLLERVAGIEPENEVVAQDLKNLRAGNICPTNDCVWFLQDEGAGPVLEEFRMDIPVVTPTGLLSVSFAVPKLISRQSAPIDYVSVTSGGSEIPDYTLSNLDRVVQSEFKKRQPAVIGRAVIGATARVIAQSELNKHAGPFGQLAGLIGNIALTSADVRSWRSTPGMTRLSKIRKNGSPLILSSGGWSEPVELPTTNMQIVYVKQPSIGTPALVNVLHLNRQMAIAAGQERRDARAKALAAAAVAEATNVTINSGTAPAVGDAEADALVNSVEPKARSSGDTTTIQ